MPWLLDEAEKTLDKKILARALLDCEYQLCCVGITVLRPNNKLETISSPVHSLVSRLPSA